MTPHLIAAELQTERPDLVIGYVHTGGGIWCIEILDPTEQDEDRAIYIGIGNGNLGWGDGDGTEFGEWEDLVNTDQDLYDWENGGSLRQAMDVYYHLKALIAQRWPKPE